ncbi:MAG: hypothetical protein HY918_03310 [Candidatus Doudnabacteria bacterium]|nr:hypothetical protein [Candidatus Doudnabacteria bacterium]
MPKYFKFYLIWAILVFVLVFVKGGFSTDNITHFLILVFLGINLWLFKKRGKYAGQNPKRYFIWYCVLSAAVVEGCYMITSPVFTSLRFTAGMSGGQMLVNYLIDLTFTVPAYFLIFRVVWWLINKYQYNVWQVAILFALGQGLGDGSRTFLANPGLLIFIPYILINYHAMNVVPFLKVQDALPAERSNSFLKYLAPVVLLFLTYIFCGVIIYTVGAIFKLK